MPSEKPLSSKINTKKRLGLAMLLSIFFPLLNPNTTEAKKISKEAVMELFNGSTSKEDAQLEMNYALFENIARASNYPRLIFGQINNFNERNVAYREMCERVSRNLKFLESKINEFCIENKNPTEPGLHLNKTLYKILTLTNNYVNMNLAQVKDSAKDFWDEQNFLEKGDCEEFVMAKYFVLRNYFNIPAESLSLAYVKNKTQDGRWDGHLVLLAHVFLDDKPITLTLDNLRNDIFLHTDSSHLQYIAGTTASNTTWRNLKKDFNE